MSVGQESRHHGNSAARSADCRVIGSLNKDIDPLRTMASPFFIEHNIKASTLENPFDASQLDWTQHAISSARLWQDIMTTSRIGASDGHVDGMSRLALSEADQRVRKWFQEQAQVLGYEMKIDEVCNMFATLPGACRSIPSIGVGSHLDTQPSGVGLGLSGRQTYADVTVVNWTNEEGARYESDCTGSAVWSGHTPLEKALAMRRADSNSPNTFGDDLQAMAYQAPVPASHLANPLSAHFELHIDNGQRVGVVTAIQGVQWYTVEVRGQQAHAGCTLMSGRADALVAASELNAFATVGTLEVVDGSSNIIPGRVRFTIDLRHSSQALLAHMKRQFRQKMAELEACAARGKSGTISFETVRQAAEATVGPADAMSEMISFAGHGSALVHLTGIPTAMIFVPSRNGVSHAPEEFTNPSQW
ncbi:hypothetical protein N7488_012353 [Penicillium malachiteum]|nr:hypothetical protein N7488_012353 [Penicillium malachiteum]